MFRDLKADEIEVRIGTVNKFGVTALLYKDARADMTILDEAVSPLLWKRSHSRENANCTVSIFNKDINEWVSKEDTGTESNTEKEKGQASDSFKRACTNWGIGRELYTAPTIFIKATTVQNGNFYKLTDEEKKRLSSMTVSDISIKDKKIIGLEIKDKEGKTIYKLGSKTTPQATQTPQLSKYIGKAEMDKLKAIDLLDEVKGEIVRGFGFGSSKEITLDKFPEVLKTFQRAEGK